MLILISAVECSENLQLCRNGDSILVEKSDLQHLGILEMLRDLTSIKRFTIALKYYRRPAYWATLIFSYSSRLRFSLIQ